MKTAPILAVNGLRGGYGSGDIVKGVSFLVERGEFVGLIGPNGSGKTTLLRLLTRVLLPRHGAVQLDRTDTATMERKRFCRAVGFVPQDVSVHFPFSVWDFVCMGRIPHTGRLDRETGRDTAAVTEALHMTDSFALRSKRVDELSAGERQRVIVARSLAGEPTLLFLDEPTSHLDIAHQARLLDILKRLNRDRGVTVLIVLHDLNLASEYCGRVMLFDGGTVFKDGTPEDVLTYQNIEAVYKTVVVVRTNPISHKPHVMLVSEETRCQKS